MCTRGVCNNTIFYCGKIQKHSSCTKSRPRYSLKRVLLHNSGDNNINDNLKMLPGIHTNSVLFTFLLLLKYNYWINNEKEEFIWAYSPGVLRIHNMKKAARAGSWPHIFKCKHEVERARWNWKETISTQAPFFFFFQNPLRFLCVFPLTIHLFFYFNFTF